MKIDRQELRALLGALGVTEPDELDCEEFLTRVSGYLEQVREVGTPPVEGHRRFLHHLVNCMECGEEFDALCAAMRDGML